VSRSGSGSSGGAGATGAADRFVTRVLRWGPGLLLALWLLAHASGFTVLRPVQQLDAWLHDARLRLFARATPDDRIAIVAIDERSLAELGRWPWSRARLADLLETIFTRDGAALVGLDVILAEPDRSSGLAALDELAAGPLRGNVGFAAALGARRAALDHDARLAATLRARPDAPFSCTGGVCGTCRARLAIPRSSIARRRGPVSRPDGRPAARSPSTGHLIPNRSMR